MNTLTVEELNAIPYNSIGVHVNKWNESTVNKLIQAWSIGASDKEACLLADISMTTLYKRLKADDALKEKRDRLKKLPTLQARAVIAEKLKDGDDITARWYLERKERQEFSAKADIQLTATVEPTIEERREQLAGFMEQFRLSDTGADSPTD